MALKNLYYNIQLTCSWLTGCNSVTFAPHLRRLHEESMAKLAYAWNPPDMDPRNVTLRGAAVDIDPAEESTREESTREGSTLAKEMR